jgi:hydroxypyruvate isomerase
MRFSANVSILFNEVPLLERFGRAAEAGFSSVEFWWPGHDADLGDIERAVKDATLEVPLFNFDAGDMPAGDRGLASDPGREQQFRDNVPVALELARSLECRRMNVLVGHEIPGMDRDEQLALARENVRFAAGEAAGVTVMVEAVNTFENGPYLLYTTGQAVEFVRDVGRDVGSPAQGRSTTLTSSANSKNLATKATSAWSTTRRRRPPRRVWNGCRRNCGAGTWPYLT